MRGRQENVQTSGVIRVSWRLTAYKSGPTGSWALKGSSFMRQYLAPLLAFALVAVLIQTGAAFAGPLAVDTEKLASIQFKLVGLEKSAEKLGLPGKKHFSLQDLNTEIIVIELFSMYCPHCQREAPKVNKLYQRLQDSKGLAGRTLFMGIGVGNTPYEVKIFGKKYSVGFPLIADPELKVEAALKKQTRTPTFIVLRRVNDKEFKLVHSVVGPIDDITQFIESVNAGAR